MSRYIAQGTAKDGNGRVICDATVAVFLENSVTVATVYRDATATVIAGAFVIGASYVIASIGTTNFTLIGASANTVGLTFTATGVGSGTGTATSIHVHSVTSGSAISDQPGHFYFYVDDGDYLVIQRFKIIITKDGFNPSTYDYMMIFPLSVTGLTYLGRISADPDPVALGWGPAESGYFWDNISDPVHAQRKYWNGSAIVLEA